MTLIKRARLATLFVAALVLTACGSSSSSPLTRSQFISRADRVCRVFSGRISALNPQLNAATTPAAVASLLRQEQQLVHTGVSELRAIPEPPADKASITAIISQADWTAALGAMADAAQRGDRATLLADAARLRQSHATYQRLAQGYGLHYCGRSQQGSTTASTPSSVPPAKARFIARADRICSAALTAVDPAQAALQAALQQWQAHDTAANRQALVAALNRYVGALSTTLDDLRALRPPRADRVVFGKYLASVSTQVGLVEQFTTAVEKDDLNRVHIIDQQAAKNTQLGRGLAQGYGFKVCGSG